MNRSKTIMIVLLLTWMSIAGGRLDAAELTIPTVDAAPFDKIEIPVLVTDFNDVAGIQLYITYDVEFLTVDSINLDNLPGATFNLGINNEVIVIWEDYLNPITLGDGEALLVMYFSVGASLGSLSIGFSDDPIYHVELLDETAEIIPVTLNSGGVNITPTDTDNNDGALPSSFSLRQNYPNPFNPATTVGYTLDRKAELIFEVFNVTGQRVDRIDLGVRPAGYNSFVYRADKLASGVYTYRLSGGGRSLSREMILLK